MLHTKYLQILEYFDMQPQTLLSNELSYILLYMFGYEEFLTIYFVYLHLPYFQILFSKPILHWWKYFLNNGDVVPTCCVVPFTECDANTLHQATHLGGEGERIEIFFRFESRAFASIPVTQPMFVQ